MNRTINQIINDIRALEDELEDIIDDQQRSFLYQIKGAKIEFEKPFLLNKRL